jgi:hypothetical protein
VSSEEYMSGTGVVLACRKSIGVLGYSITVVHFAGEYRCTEVYVLSR